VKRYYFTPQSDDIAGHSFPATQAFLARDDVVRAIAYDQKNRRDNERHQRAVESEQPRGSCRCREGWHVLYPSTRDILGFSTQRLFCEPT